MTVKYKILAIVVISVFFAGLPPVSAPRGPATVSQPALPVSRSTINSQGMYSEQIQVYLAGSYSLIRQSALTVDNFSLNQVPLDDPAFWNASFVMFFSNGIYPEYYTDPYTPSNELASFQIPIKGFYVYLSYSVKNCSTAVGRAAKVISLLQDAFGVQLFQVENGQQNAFTYYGVAPAWPNAINELTAQLPTDGYIGDINQTRITSTSYTASNDLSGGMISIDPYGGSLTGINFTSAFSQILDVFSSSTTSLITSAIGLNFTTTSVSSIVPTRTNILFVQYEGEPRAIVQSGDQYTFDLKKALGLPASAMLQPSGMVWNSLLNLNPEGVLTSLISVNVISGDVQQWSLGPNHITIDSQIISTINLASGLIGGSVNIDQVLSALQFIVDNVYFITSWQKTGVLETLYSNLNMTQAGIQQLLTEAGYSPTALDFILNNINLDVSPLTIAGFNGLPFVPTGLLVAIPDVNVTYTITPEQAQPILLVKQQTDLAIKPFQQSLNLNMTITNVGSKIAWGVLIANGVANLSSLVSSIPGVPHLLGVVNYEVRGFSIPGLITTNSLGAYYGADNILINYSSYSGGGSEETTIKDLMQTIDEDTNDIGFLDLHELGVLTSADPYNYIKPGQTIKIDLPSTDITGLYTPFTNETGQFSTATIVYGTQQGTNNDSAAKTTNGVPWDVSSQSVESGQGIAINFTFSNVTNNIKTRSVAALDFTYVGNLNTSVYAGGNATFVIDDYNNSINGHTDWIPVNNLVNSPVSINGTSPLTSPTTFTIVNGSKDISNNIIDIDNFMQGRNNTVTLQLQVYNDVPTLDEIDSLTINYLQKNLSVVLVPAQTVGYTDLQGITLCEATSNSLYGISMNASILEASQQLVSPGSYLCMPGDNETMAVSIKNVGTEDAKSANVSITIPGIIINTGNLTVNGTIVNGVSLTVNGNFLDTTISSLAPNATATILYQFRVPNSEIIPGTTIEYTNGPQANASTNIVTANDLYLDAVINYTSQADAQPCVIPVNATMALVTAIPVNTSDTFNVSYSVAMANVPDWMDNLNVSLQQTPYFNTSGSFYQTIDVSTAAGSTTGTLVQNFTKVSYEGYLLPAMAIGADGMASLLRLSPMLALQIGTEQFTIQKTVKHDKTNESSTFTIIRDDKISVKVTINNTGTLPIGMLEKADPTTYPQGFLVTDNYGYQEAGFTIISGNVSMANVTLQPGASASFSYTLSAQAVGTFSLGSVQVVYYFLTKQTVTSNSFTVHVQEKPGLIAAYIATGLGVTVLIALGSVQNRQKQRKALENFMKKDKILYEEIRKEGTRNFAEYLDEGKESAK
jgi:hypothetical protein